MNKAGSAARRATLKLLHGVLFDGEMLSHLIAWREGPLAGLDGPERARAQSLTTTVLRNLEPLDHVLASFINKEPPFIVLNILRICAAEVIIDGIAPYGAVDGAVSMVKGRQRFGHMTGLVNAVGRKLATEGADVFAKQAVQMLPDAMRDYLIEIYGAERVAAIELAHANPVGVDVTVKSDPAGWAEKLGAELLPTGSLRLNKPAQISTLEGYDTGDWWIQDAAAAIPAKCFGDLKGKRVLDLCAAPGGKTMQLAASGAQVTALDSSKSRMRRLTENLTRTGLEAKTVIKDILKWTPEAPFDAILLDAPCSATGTIRRHPDLPFVKSELDLEPLVTLQREMLSKANDWLVSGGELVFSTCSLFPDEGENHQAFVAESLPNLKTVALSPSELGLPESNTTNGKALRLSPDLWPEMGGMDGFCIAKFQKIG